MSQAFDLNAVRQQIDALDIKIQNLITQRANLASDVANAKRAVENDPDFYRPEREAQVLRMAVERNRGPLPDKTIRKLFQHIMSACLALQKPLIIAYLGPQGTYTQTAMKKHFGHAVKEQQAKSIDSVFQEVVKNHANYGIVPLENSTEGGVNTTLDTLVTTSLKICGEVDLPIHHYLLSNCHNLKQIKRVYSHQQSLGQCQHWLNENLPQAELFSVASNAEGAKRAVNESNVAAVAGKTAMTLYQLKALASHIEDNPDNVTRFIILGKQDTLPTGKDKTSLVFTSTDADHAGDLYRVLKPLAKANINMTRIESRPSRQSNWNYVFFIDIQGHQTDTVVKNALKSLQKHSAFFKVLGSYPCAVQ